MAAVGAVTPVWRPAAAVSVTVAARAVAFALNAVQCVLQRGDQDATALVASHLALLDEGDGGDQGLDGASILAVGSVLDSTGNGAA